MNREHNEALKAYILCTAFKYINAALNTAFKTLNTESKAKHSRPLKNGKK